MKSWKPMTMYLYQDERGRRTASKSWEAMIRLHDRVFSDDNRSVLKRLVVKFSIAGFAVHLLLVFFARTFQHQPHLLAAVGTNYLSAITTPFNFILFYEVLTLIAALPASTTRSIANQFEIVSLVFIRDAFRDIADADGPNWLLHAHQEIPLMFDMWGGLLMFLLVTVFQHVASRQVRLPRTPEITQGRKKFIAQKKVVALCLTLLLLALAAYHLTRFIIASWSAAHTGDYRNLRLSGVFYHDLFTVMIVTDVLILILSLVVSARYEMVFRNAAFVVSIILIRFSLSESRPYGAAIALLSMIFGILTLLVFNYHSRLRASESLQNAKCTDAITFDLQQPVFQSGTSPASSRPGAEITVVNWL
ncbi:hypothetical protein [Edaphobacter aggregans]|uniref:hypothetical protein n=1 Tax=Edaphobacter aggregans TaxID=570835 RepID=UPI0012FC0ED5|nr:hypothetical protein [Edaphobacter aggregans]